MTCAIAGDDERRRRVKLIRRGDISSRKLLVIKLVTSNIIMYAPWPVGKGGGSGFIDAAKGLVVTASDAVATSNRFTVEIGKKRMRAELLADARAMIPAALKICNAEGSNGDPACIEAPGAGRYVIALGFPAVSML